MVEYYVAGCLGAFAILYAYIKCTISIKSLERRMQKAESKINTNEYITSVHKGTLDDLSRGSEINVYTKRGWVPTRVLVKDVVGLMLKGLKLRLECVNSSPIRLKKVGVKKNAKTT